MNKLHFGVLDTGFGSTPSRLGFGLAKECGFLSKNRDEDGQQDTEKTMPQSMKRVMSLFLMNFLTK